MKILQPCATIYILASLLLIANYVSTDDTDPSSVEESPEKSAIEAIGEAVDALEAKVKGKVHLRPHNTQKGRQLEDVSTLEIASGIRDDVNGDKRDAKRSVHEHPNQKKSHHGEKESHSVHKKEHQAADHDEPLHHHQHHHHKDKKENPSPEVVDDDPKRSEKHKD